MKLFIIALLAAVVCPLSILASDIDRIRELNQQILSDFSSKSVRRDASHGAAVRERAVLLEQLFLQDPAAARNLVLRPETLQSLRLAGSPDANVERPFAYAGPVEASVVDFASHKRSVRSYAFEKGNKTITARGGPALDLRCGDEVRVEGFRLGSVVMVTAASVERHAEAAAECRTDGFQRIAVILANFLGEPAPSLTRARVGELLFAATGRSAATFYKEASYSQLDLTGDVFGWYTLDRAYSCSEPGQLRDAALKAADAEIDFTLYSRVIIIHPPSEGCEVLGQEHSGALLRHLREKSFAPRLRPFW